MITGYLFTIFLVLLNGFFVAAEFSIVKVRASQVDLKVSKGSKRAKMTAHILSNLDKYLSATQLGITLASLALGWIGEDVVAKSIMRLLHYFNFNMSEVLAHRIAIPVGFTFITIAHIVFGELAPKIMAIRNPLSVSLVISFPLRVFYVLFIPFIWFINRFSTLVLNLMGIKAARGDSHTEEELRMILTESEESGAIKPSENELIQNVFDFDDRMVKQVMIPTNRIVAIDVEMGREQVVKKVLEEGYSRLPVYLGDIDNVIGILNSKDLLKAVIENRFNSIRDIMRPAQFVPENMKVNELLRNFQRLHTQITIVTNEFGATAGIVTMEDIIEELVGEIRDEHDEEKPDIEKKSDSEYFVKAQTTLVDVNESLPIALPESPHYDTISGYVNYIFGRIPALNETKTYGGYELTIISRKKQNVELVKFRVLDNAIN
ncbi:MAG TPA: hemolysin family protein [Bacteroidia bacterium]|jgi:CBS domain containing-hemolysin-like protein|nr:hemolysin family protein [Bacteroidia bacterium]